MGSCFPQLIQEGRAAMSELTIWTYDWVPEGPRGFVRDLRLRWACEEAGLIYAVRTIPFDGRETNHLAHQPFGQVPFLKDEELEIFESGAGLLHLARKSDKLMPRDPAGEAATLQWTIAALNSIEMVTVPWWFLKISGAENAALTEWVGQRLDHMERVLSAQDWLAAGRFLGTHEQFTDSVMDLSSHYVSSFHGLLNHTCDLDGDNAHCETYHICIMINETPPFLMSAGRYIDHFQRREGEWKIANRVVV